jgi:predicted RNA binding protein YcfA (HicA-like mRNA interferase family)
VNDYGKQVRERLKEAGCEFVRHGRGDHDIWRSPLTKRPLTVPVKIRSRHLANKILKDAGLSKSF